MQGQRARGFAALSIASAFCTVIAASRAEASDGDPWDAENWGHEPGLAPDDEPEVAANDEARPAPSDEREARGPTFEFSDHFLTVNAMLGLGTPVGLIGGTIEINPVSRLALGLGAGTNTEGLQLAALVRSRPFAWARPKRALAITLGAALAAGPHRPFDFDPAFGSLDHRSPEERARDVDEAYERVYWLQPDVGFELQAKSGFHLVVSQGVAVPLGHSGHHCDFRLSGERTVCPNAGTPREAQPQAFWTVTVMLGFSLW
jgi:hypothetical protein